MARPKHFVYKITNTVNGKIYIGKTSNIARRWNEHLRAMYSRDTHLYNSMRKYGIDVFKIEIIEAVTKSRVDETEQYWIAKLNTTDNSIGYNTHAGGTGGDTFTYRSSKSKNETRVKLSNATKQRYSNADNIERSRETSIQLWKNPEYRRKVTNAVATALRTSEYRNAQSKRMKQLLKQPEMKKIWSDAKLGIKNSKWGGYVYAVDPKLKTHRFDTIKIAAAYIGVSAGALSEHINNCTIFTRGNGVGWKFFKSKRKLK